VSNISKIIERLMKDRITKFIDNNNLLNNTQNGYISGRSTTRAMFQLIDDIIDGLSKRESTSCVLLDLSRAFDSVDIRVLLDKLEVMGFRGVAWAWIKSYLSGRRQCVAAQDEDGRELRSGWKAVTRGVPQGSILGPLLFLMYVNDLPGVVASLTVMFADDTAIVTRAQTEEESKKLSEENLRCVEEWLGGHNLKFNIGKTKLLIFNNDPTSWELQHESEVLVFGGCIVAGVETGLSVVLGCTRGLLGERAVWFLLRPKSNFATSECRSGNDSLLRRHLLQTKIWNCVLGKLGGCW
jgi:hypothetical protein